MPSKQQTPEFYETTKSAIDDCLKQFNGLTNSLNEVSNQASLLGRSLQVLEDMTAPYNIGDEQVKKNPTRKFKYSAPLNDALDTFSKWELRKLFTILKLKELCSIHRILITYSEKIKNEAVDSFDNFIIQAILPSEDEIKAVHEHNRSVNRFPSHFLSKLMISTVKSSMNSASHSLVSTIISWSWQLNWWRSF